MVDFVTKTTKPHSALITLELLNNQSVFYVMIIYDAPQGLRLFDIKHPKQVKVLSRLTWSIKHLETWMLNKGSKDHQYFGSDKERSILDYSIMHDPQ